jgi:hypothetical protein
MSALEKLGSGIRNAWRRYRWRWHEPGGVADEWDPLGGHPQKEYERPGPWHWPWNNQKKQGQDDTDRQAGNRPRPG